MKLSQLVDEIRSNSLLAFKAIGQTYANLQADVEALKLQNQSANTSNTAYTTNPDSILRSGAYSANKNLLAGGSLPDDDSGSGWFTIQNNRLELPDRSSPFQGTQEAISLSTGIKSVRTKPTLSGPWLAWQQLTYMPGATPDVPASAGYSIVSGEVVASIDTVNAFSIGSGHYKLFFVTSEGVLYVKTATALLALMTTDPGVAVNTTGTATTATLNAFTGSSVSTVSQLSAVAVPAGFFKLVFVDGETTLFLKTASGTQPLVGSPTDTFTAGSAAAAIGADYAGTVMANLADVQAMVVPAGQFALVYVSNDNTLYLKTSTLLVSLLTSESETQS